MAYNTTTERLLNAIKSNTANITLTIPDGAFDNVQISAIDETTQTDIKTATEATQAAAEDLISNASVVDKINLYDLKTLLDTLVSVSSGAGTAINLKDVIDSLVTALDTNLDTNSSLVTAVSNLTAAHADTGNDVTLEDLRLLLKTIDTDTGDLKTNSDTSLALNTAPSVIGNTTTIVNDNPGTNVAVTFLEATAISSIEFGGVNPSAFNPAVPVAAGMTIYGDITTLTIGGDAKTCIVYKA